jgi:hypothetical protein
MLGWDVGTFEFTSERILATGWTRSATLKLRTGGSSGKIGRTVCKALEEGDGYFWDLQKGNVRQDARLPVKYRYRSPIVFEFHIAGKRKAASYAVIWLHHLIDNEDTPINIPIWETSAPARLTQNYITEANCQNEVGMSDLKEVGRLQFCGRFKAGMDESHKTFISDNDSRETYETWEACLTEGVRTRKVDKEVPDVVQQMHEDSLSEGRDVLKAQDELEKQKWLDKSGTDWSGAFGQDPKAFVDGPTKKKRREPGVNAPLHDPHHPSSDEHSTDEEDILDTDSEPDLGIQTGDNTDHFTRRGEAPSSDDTQNGKPLSSVQSATTFDTTTRDQSLEMSSKDVNQQNRRTEQRKHRGLMQWKPARNAKFTADEGKLGLKKLKNRLTGGLEGRQPDVETGGYTPSARLMQVKLLTMSQKLDLKLARTVLFRLDNVSNGLGYGHRWNPRK